MRNLLSNFSKIKKHKTVGLLKYVYSLIISALIFVPLGFLLFILAINSDSPYIALVMFSMVIPFLAMGVGIVLSVVLIIFLYRKNGWLMVFKLILVNLTIPVLIPILYFSWMNYSYSLDKATYEAKYQKLVSVENIEYKELDRNNNKQKDTLELSFTVKSSVTTEDFLLAHFGYITVINDNKESVMRESLEVNPIAYELSNGLHDCKMYFVLDETLSEEEFKFDDYLLSLKIVDDKTSDKTISITEKRLSIKLKEWDKIGRVFDESFKKVSPNHDGEEICTKRLSI